MRRLFWVAAGAAAGIYLARRLQRTAESLTPAGIAESVGDGLRELADAIRAFADDVRDAMSERENELRDALGLDDDERAGAQGESVTAPATGQRGSGPSIER